MKEHNHKKRYNNNKKRKEIQEQFVVTPEIAEDIDNILSEAVNTIKAKYPGSEGAMDTFLAALAQAMTDIINSKTEQVDEEAVEIEENKKSYDAPVILEGKIPEPVKDHKKKDKELIAEELEAFLNDDDEDDDEIKVKTYGKVKNAGSACSSWYNVHYTLDASDTSGCMKVRAIDDSDAERKVINRIDEDCTIDFVEELDDDDEFEDDIPVGYPDDDDEWDDDDENFSLARAAFHRKPKRRF